MPTTPAPREKRAPAAKPAARQTVPRTSAVTTPAPEPQPEPEPVPVSAAAFPGSRPAAAQPDPEPAPDPWAALTEHLTVSRPATVDDLLAELRRDSR